MSHDDSIVLKQDLEMKGGHRVKRGDRERDWEESEEMDGTQYKLVNKVINAPNAIMSKVV